METEKLYYQDAAMREFDGTVLSCTAEGQHWAVVLDKTAFYPEGGGQGADTGRLGASAVLDTQEKDGVIVHTCDKALPAGGTVRGAIDWDRRFDHMQQHSGEHIVSGMLCSAYHCDNVGFHMGAESIIIDYNADIPWEGVLEIEQRANRYIWENHPLEVLWPTPAELAALPYRSKKALSGAVRLTSFPGADLCACCGTHVSASAQVGLVKFIGWQKFRDGVRLELLCGGRAMAYLSASWEQNRQVGQLLSVKPDKTFAAVSRLRQELLTVKETADALEEASFASLAAQYAGAGNVAVVRPPMEPDKLRRLCDAVSRSCGGRCAVFAGEGETYKYAVIHAGTDISPWVKALNGALRGRGGGRDGFAQGSLSADIAAIETFCKEHP